MGRVRIYSETPHCSLKCYPANKLHYLVTCLSQTFNSYLAAFESQYINLPVHSSFSLRNYLSGLSSRKRTKTKQKKKVKFSSLKWNLWTGLLKIIILDINLFLQPVHYFITLKWQLLATIQYLYIIKKHKSKKNWTPNMSLLVRFK